MDLEKLSKQDLIKRIRQLENSLSEYAKPVCFVERLSRLESKVLACLLSAQGLISNRAIRDAIYTSESKPDPFVINRFVYRIRQKLGPYGLVIDRTYGVGYSLPPKSREMLEKQLKEAL